MVTLCEITAGAAEASIWGVVGHVLLLFLFSFIAAMVVMTFAGLSVVAERKVCAFIQGRLGPNRTAIPIVAAIPLLGNFLKRNGLMQLLADALKFLFKEDPIPGHVNKFWYMAAPAMFLAPVLIVGAVIPFGVYWSDGSMHPIAVADFNLSIIFMLAISSLTVFGGLMAGWSSNSKLPYIAATRSGAQIISYELTMGITIVTLVIWAATMVENPLNIFEVAAAQSGLWFCITQPLGAFLFLVALFAETNRLPFDVSESEADLVSGVHTEYGSFKFGLFYVGEYGHMALASMLFVTLFLGAWYPFPGCEWPSDWGWISSVLSVFTFLVKVAFMIFFFIWMRWTLPRFRYDQVMRLGWSVLVPLGIANFVFYLVLISL